jgi:hypothetical protein
MVPSHQAECQPNASAWHKESRRDNKLPLFNYGVRTMPKEGFWYRCPHCSHERNAADVAKDLPDEVLRQAVGPGVARLRRTRVAGPGRPTVARCPGCSQQMSSADLREHRIPCVRAELEKLRRWPIQLTPKDPDPYPNFYLHHVGETEVGFEKGSNKDLLTVDLRKIADITVNQTEQMAYIRVLGRIAWHSDIKRWRFDPTSAVGRPSKPMEASG